MNKNKPRKYAACLGQLAVASMASMVLMACTSTAPEQKSGNAEGPARPVGGHGGAAFMGSYDANRDGVVTRDEYDAVRKQRFMTADANRDGWLSEEEYVAEFKKRLDKDYGDRAHDERYANSIKQAHVRFKILDRNDDGRLSVEEELAQAEKTFKGADTNGDGKIDAADGKK